MSDTVSFQYRVTAHGVETCSCSAPGCPRGVGLLRCGKPARYEVSDPFSGTDVFEYDVCAECFESHFPEWLCS